MHSFILSNSFIMHLYRNVYAEDAMDFTLLEIYSVNNLAYYYSYNKQKKQQETRFTDHTWKL